MATAAQVKRSWRVRKAWQSRWKNRLDRLRRLKNAWGEEWVEKNKSKNFIPDRSESELEEKWRDQRARNRRWLISRREKFNEKLPDPTDI